MTTAGIYALGIGYSNFNGQSSGRILASSSSGLPGVRATAPPLRGAHVEDSAVVAFWAY